MTERRGFLSRGSIKKTANRSQPPEQISTQSGKRGSNSRPSAWEADALPTELLPHSVIFNCATKLVIFLFASLFYSIKRVKRLFILRRNMVFRK